MKAVFTVLLVANLLLAAYAWFGSHEANPDAALVGKQMNAEQIQIIAPRPVVMLDTSQLKCLEWGSFGAGEAERARAALETLRLTDRATAHDVQVVAGYWVYIPPLSNKSEVEKKVAELKELGVIDYFAVENSGPMKNAISLGIFKTEEAANNYLERLKQKPVKSARVGSREHRVTQTAFVLREPDVATTALLAELRLQFPGSELKAVSCGG